MLRKQGNVFITTHADGGFFGLGPRHALRGGLLGSRGHFASGKNVPNIVPAFQNAIITDNGSGVFSCAHCL